MKKISLISILICILFSCSKTDIQKVDCSAYSIPFEPVVCDGTFCQSDTCQTYLIIWKNLLMSRNQMTQNYFNDHITPCETSIDKWNSGISFRITYNVKVDWAEVQLWDTFIIWLAPNTTGLYPSLDLPRNILLTKDQINSAANIMAFSTSINTITSINSLKYNSVNEAMKDLSRASGVDKLCRYEFYYERPHMVVPPSGYPFIRAYAVLSNEANSCMTSQLNLYTGEADVTINPCMIIFCVAQGTQITLNSKSNKTIENIKIGDTVLSVNIKTLRIEEDLIQKIDSVTHKDLIKISFNDFTELSATQDHPIYIKNKGWCSFNPTESQEKLNIQTKKLEPGDVCFKIQDNRLIESKIESITKETGSFKTYNISKLRKNKNYFANGILISTEEK